MILNNEDLQKVGKHDFEKEYALNYEAYEGQKSFSINIFSWGLYSNGKKLKKLGCKVRVHGKPSDRLKMIAMAELVVQQLNDGDWDGRKNVFV